VGGYLDYWLRRRRPLSLPLFATLFGAGILVSLLIILRLIFANAPDAYWLSSLLVMIPFICAGAFLAEVFARYPAWSGRLYAWDLAGAAATALGIIGLLQFIDAIDACLLLAVLGGLAGALVPADPPAPARRFALAPVVFSAVFLVIFLVNLRLPLFAIPPIPPRFDAAGNSLADKGVTQPLFTEMGDPTHTSRIVATRWNAFARTDVVAESSDDYLIYTNGNVPTNMMAWDGKVESLGAIAAEFPLCDWAFANAALGSRAAPHGAVLSIGPGGGLDALLALWHGAQAFDGAEINPSIISLMRDYRAFNGGIYDYPGVRVQTAEGRAFAREQAAQGRRYALIFSALTKTATAGQGMALLESYIHTQDAVSDYLDALQEDGQLVWLVDKQELLARFFATAVAELGRRGIPEQEACRHLALVCDPRPIPYRFAMVLRKSAFTAQQGTVLAQSARARNLKAFWIPGQPGAGPYPDVAAGKLTLPQFIGAFLRETGLDVSPCPDNRPYVLDLNPGILPVFSQMALLAMVLAVALALIGWRAGTAAAPPPLRREKRGQARMSTDDGTPEPVPVFRSPATGFGRDDLLAIGYFLLLGIGFMLVEIPLIEKLILPLGYPTLALTIILFSLLLGGGLGSAVSQRFAGKALQRWAVFAALGVALLTLLSMPAISWLQHGLVGLTLPVRCLLAAGLLLPLGFLLGTPFPAGLRLFTREQGGMVPLIWGVNGVASVVGSLCAAMGGKALGFNAMLTCGAAAYLVAVLLLRAQRVREQG
jgi:hypothetical protein